MHHRLALLFLLPFVPSSLCNLWSYKRFQGKQTEAGEFVADTRHEVELEEENHFIQWLHDVSETQDSGEVRHMFTDNTIPRNVTNLDTIFEQLEPPPPEDLKHPVSPLRPPMIPNLPSGEAEELFKNLGYPLDPKCTVDKSKWWYRTYDGSCNWLKKDETNEGQIGMAKSRDFGQHAYADGVSKPREGPNPRAVSNAFFKREKEIYYEHTPLLLGLIEFIMHDITYSMDSPDEVIEVTMPDDEEVFDKNTTFKVSRTKAVAGTGESVTNPRENVNMASTWLDISSLYGSTEEVGRALRSFKGGKLLNQELKTPGASRAASYLPFNAMDVPMRTMPYQDPKTLFAGGDPRTNEDWLLLAVHTLILREHNRLCDILAEKHPEYDDEQLYQTVRLLMAAKYALIANAYQMAYWTDEMPWPRDDGFPLYRQMYGESVLEINPMNTYPWPLVTKSGKPMVVSAEMAVVYRFHDFIIKDFPIKDASNVTLRNQSVFDTGFNPQGFIDTGLENILRGMVNTYIPNFKSGVDESFRSANHYRAAPFDIATWSIVHEREQGLPTYNAYFREYNRHDPNVTVKIPRKFEEFSSDPEKVAKLKSLYKSPDDVDLVVGVQLDEEYFPGTTVPKSALIISLFSLFGMGNSDRFSIGFAVTRCFLVDKPWDCHPSNALEDILWQPRPTDEYPNMRWLDQFWINELDFPNHGTNLLWRLVTENSEIDCLQRDPLFPADPKTNPLQHSLQPLPLWKVIFTALLSAFEIALAWLKLHWKELLGTTAVTLLSLIIRRLLQRLRWKWINAPAVYWGLPIVGKAVAFQKDPRDVLRKGFTEIGNTMSQCFGIKLASLVHFVITKKCDLAWIIEDNPNEKIFSLHEFLAAINFPLIVHQDNFDSDIHTKLIRKYLGDASRMSQFGSTMLHASNRFIDANFPTTRDSKHLSKFVPTLMRYITTVVGGFIVGEEVFDHPDLLQIFADFNDHAIQAMGLSGLLPSSLQFIARFSIDSDYKKARELLIPIIQNRRKQGRAKRSRSSNLTLLDLLLDEVQDDQKASDLVVIIVWGGLTNLQATFTSLVMDIINDPEARQSLTAGLASVDPNDLSVFDEGSSTNPTNPWTPLRAAMFESIRLSGPIVGPARLVLKDAVLPSSTVAGNGAASSNAKPQKLPAKQVATLSAYYTHRDPAAYPEADKWVPSRFQNSNPDIGSPTYISWGLKGPHMCPGRWFAQECILIMTKCLLGRYDIVPDRQLGDDEKYVYSGGSVARQDTGVTVTLKA